jgi:TonB-dependent SusC/RagA subfamily outer membrane receptor
MPGLQPTSQGDDMRRSWLVPVGALVLVSACSAERVFGTRTVAAPAAPARVRTVEPLGLVAGAPLYVLDGRVLPRDDADSTGMPGAVRTLKAEQIETIEVLKGQSAQRRYGTAGENGVILIRTRHAN